jgi:hypothetical protein
MTVSSTMSRVFIFPLKLNISAMAFVLLKRRQHFRYMSQRIKYVDMLGAAIRLKHGCRQTHRKSVFVSEKLNNETVWEGFVEVFDLTGHPKARVCYAWQDFTSNGVKIFTVLENQLIDSPSRAIQAAIFVDEQSPARPDRAKARTPENRGFLFSHSPDAQTVA